MIGIISMAKEIRIKIVYLLLGVMCNWLSNLSVNLIIRLRKDWIAFILPKVI